MIFRIIIILMIVFFYNPIFNFFKMNKIDTIKNVKKTIVKNTNNLVDNIVNNEFKNVLEKVKKIDKQTYKKCIKILKNLKRMKHDIEKNRHIDFKNEFENMKLQKKEMLNLLAAMVVTHGFFSSHSKILEISEKYLKDILLEVLEMGPKRFEDDLDEVEPDDSYSPNFSYNYNIY